MKFIARELILRRLEKWENGTEKMEVFRKRPEKEKTLERRFLINGNTCDILDYLKYTIQYTSEKVTDFEEPIFTSCVNLDCILCSEQPIFSTK